MQQPTDISEKVFLDLKSILKSLAEIPNLDQFLDKKEDIEKIVDYSAYLKVHQDFKNTAFQSEENISCDGQTSELNKGFEEKEIISEQINEHVEIPSIQIFSSEAGTTVDIDEENVEVSSKKNETSSFTEEFETVESPESLTITEELPDDHHVDDSPAQNIIHEKVDVMDEDPVFSPDEVEQLEKKHQEERKFRLSNIRGVKKMETLFEDDFLVENKVEITAEKENSLLKNNVPLDYMEAEKALPAFKLDLNDRIAFTKKLFAGSQNDLNSAVTKLNDFATLQEAKEYLSELYYEKDWEKEDEYAQRLWNLIESKF